MKISIAIQVVLHGTSVLESAIVEIAVGVTHI